MSLICVQAVPWYEHLCCGWEEPGGGGAHKPVPSRSRGNCCTFQTSSTSTLLTVQFGNWPKDLQIWSPWVLFTGSHTIYTFLHSHWVSQEWVGSADRDVYVLWWAAHTVQSQLISPGELVQVLIEDDLQGTLSTGCSSLYSRYQYNSSAFPVSKMIKTLSEQHVDRVVKLGKLPTDSVVVEEVKASGKFYNHFATMKDRRMVFLFK